MKKKKIIIISILSILFVTGIIAYAAQKYYSEHVKKENVRLLEIAKQEKEEKQQRETLKEDLMEKLHENLQKDYCNTVGTELKQLQQKTIKSLKQSNLSDKDIEKIMELFFSEANKIRNALPSWFGWYSEDDSIFKKNYLILTESEPAPSLDVNFKYISSELIPYLPEVWKDYLLLDTYFIFYTSFIGADRNKIEAFVNKYPDFYQTEKLKGVLMFQVYDYYLSSCSQACAGYCPYRATEEEYKEFLSKQPPSIYYNDVQEFYKILKKGNYLEVFKVLKDKNPDYALESCETAGVTNTDEIESYSEKMLSKYQFLKSPYVSDIDANGLEKIDKLRQSMFFKMAIVFDDNIEILKNEILKYPEKYSLLNEDDLGSIFNSDSVNSGDPVAFNFDENSLNAASKQFKNLTICRITNNTAQNVYRIYFDKSKFLIPAFGKYLSKERIKELKEELPCKE